MLIIRALGKPARGSAGWPSCGIESHEARLTNQWDHTGTHHRRVRSQSDDEALNVHLRIRRVEA